MINGAASDFISSRKTRKAMFWLGGFHYISIPGSHRAKK